MSQRRDVRVGELRPSQLITTFGVGSIVDLPNISAIVMRLEEWPEPGRILAESRLLAAVRRRLSSSRVRDLREPPIEYDENGELIDRNGVTVSLFPQWLRCPACDALAPIWAAVFDVVPDERFPDRTRVVHRTCQKAKTPSVVPARFLVACANGHMDDFPWVQFVHRFRTDCRNAELRLRKIGPSDEAGDLLVECTACGSKRNLAEAFQEHGGPSPVGDCRGRHPHLRSSDPACSEPVKPILLGASNSWFGVTLSALALPPSQQDRLTRLVEDHWSQLADVDDPAILRYLIKQSRLPQVFEDHPPEAIMAAIDRQRQPPSSDDAGTAPEDLKGPEWMVLTQHAVERESADFKARLVDPPHGFEDVFEPTLMLDRLREVRALIGFTRIEAPGEFGEEPVVAEDQMVPLGTGTASWVPATEVRGEGVFLRFREQRLASWCANADVLAREATLLDGFRRWRRLRGLPADDDVFPGIRAVLIHSFSHALMRQIALSGGYAAASIRERVYARRMRLGTPMAGLLIYTAASDSEGTLGGLVALGGPAKLGEIIQEALEQMSLCAGDPLCSEHDPEREDFGLLQGAACHACLYSPETSCEYANRFLDRLLITDGLGHDWPTFFGLFAVSHG